MKNAILLVEEKDIHAHTAQMWKTDLFRESYWTGGIVSKVVGQFAYLPRIFADMSDESLERAHFSTWWGVIMNRYDYDNPFIHDLYLLHEFFHAGNMPYVPHIGKAAFDEKMQRNELEASVLSEIQVYFEMPGLREQSFSYPIYADRFLNDPFYQALWKTNRDVAIETIRTARRHVMLSKPEHEMDTAERWIRRFAEQNAIYTVTWADRYLEVEQHMAEFQIESATNRGLAGKNHLAWLEQQRATDAIPFRQEAELFSAFYWANKAKFEVAMARG